MRRRNMSIEIRLAGPEDAETIFQLITELARVQGCNSNLPATPELLREQMSNDNPMFECLLAERPGESIGHALFFQNYSTWEGRPGLYLEDLYVRPDCQGNGVGKMLMQQLATIATERGCKRIDWTVLDTNTSGQMFYRGVGAQPLKQWHHWRLDGEALNNMAISES
jgi:GNAT superfamily N-acetyltransferase